MKRMENVARMIDKNTLVWEREFPVKPEKLWNAIATKEGLSHWFMPTPFEIEEGGRFDWEGGTEGTITEIDPPHRIRFTPDHSDESYMLLEIEETKNGCLFKLAPYTTRDILVFCLPCPTLRRSNIYSVSV